MEVSEEKGLVLLDGPAQGKTVDFLNKLRPHQTCLNVFRSVRIEAGSLVEEVPRAVKIVGPGPGDHFHLASTVTAKLSRRIAGKDTEFRQHVGIGTQGREVSSASTGFIDIDSVKRVVPGTIARTIYVDTATRDVGTPAVKATGIHHAWFKFHQRQCVSSARGYNGQRVQRDVVEEIAQVARGGSLYQFG